MAKKKTDSEKTKETKLILDEMDEPVDVTEEIEEKAEETPSDVSRETKEAEKSEEEEAETEKKSEKEEILWSAKYVLNDSEIAQFVEESDLVESKKKTYIQAALAAILCLVNVYSYAKNHRAIALILVLICAALCGAILIVPLRMRKQLTNELKAAANEDNPTRLESNGKKLTFGAGEDTVTYSYKDIKVEKHEAFVTLLLGGVQMICVPERAVSEEAWKELCSHAGSKK